MFYVTLLMGVAGGATFFVFSRLSDEHRFNVVQHDASWSDRELLHREIRDNHVVIRELLELLNSKQ